MRLHLVSICVFISFILSSCAVPDPTGMLWKTSIGGDTIFPGSQALYVYKTSTYTETRTSLRGLNINTGEMLWEMKIISNLGQLTFWEANLKKYTLQMDTYLGDDMVESSLKTDVEGYDEQTGVVFVKTIAIRLGSKSDYHRLYAIRLNDGKILWKVGLDTLQKNDLGFIIGDLFVQDGIASFVSAHYTQTGEIGNTTLYDEDIILSTYDPSGKIWSESLWSERFDEGIWGFVNQSIQFLDGKIFFNGGYPRMWDLRTGEGADMQTPASITEQNGSHPPFVIQDGIKYSTDFFTDASIFKGDFFVTARNLDTEKLLWQYKLYKEKTTQKTRGPLLTGTSVLASQGHTLYAFDKKNGSLMYQTKSVW